jgi:hypothetical protein
MGDTSDAIKALTDSVKALQATVEANAKAIAALTADKSSTSSGPPPGHGNGEHHSDRPPKF